MIIAKVKPLEEIKEMVRDYQKILNIGCAGCTAICLAGGQKEVDTLNMQLSISFKTDKIPFQVEGFTVERQCEMEFLSELDQMVENYDALLSMACGAGVQFLAERFPQKPVFPAVNTTFVGVNKDIGWYEERCQSCGDCVLGITGGICPVAMCAKGLFNGPCGGSQDGHCEVDKDIPCAWVKIYERLKEQGRLDNILKVFPARDWQNQIQGTIVLEAYKKRYSK
jgi:ferredoxin